DFHVTGVRRVLFRSRALARAVLRVLQAALPLQHRPAPEVVLRELREDRLEIDLPVAERAEAAGTVDPVLVAAIHAAARIGTVFEIGRASCRERVETR